MHIVLVAPRNPPSFWTVDGALPVIGKRCIAPNLALPTLAGLTPAIHTVTLVDENIEAVDFDVEADIVGITGFIVHRERMFELIDEFKSRGRLVAVGGAYATLCPEAFTERADVLFVGEAEETWAGFLSDFASGRWQPVYRTAHLPDISDAPLPRFDLLAVDQYWTMTMQFARGCPFDCEFCDIIVMYGRKPRTKSVTTAMEEVEALHRLGARRIFLVDDNFIGNRAVAKDLLRALVPWQKERDSPITFQTEASINLARDEELLSLLRDANFKSVFVGIESPRTASLEEAHKAFNARHDMIEAVHKIQSYGIEVQAGMIIGFDADDVDIFDEHYRFISAARIPASMTGLLNAVPKTPLHQRLAAEGRLLGETTGDQFVFTNIVPAGMDRAELYRGYRKLLERLYDYRSYHRRARALLFGIGEPVHRGRHHLTADLGILWRLVWQCVLRGSPRRSFLSVSLLVEALLRRPSRFTLAVSLAIWHVHVYGLVRRLSPLLERMEQELRLEPDGRQLLPQLERATEKVPGSWWPKRAPRAPAAGRG